MSARGLRQSYVNWWAHDLPPVSGRLRLVFYTGLLLLAFRDEKSPIRSLGDYSETSPEMFRAYGLMELLGLPHIPVPWVKVFVVALILCWVSAAAGLFRRTSAAATAVLFTCLHGLFLGSNAFNHNWFVPMNALIVLAFARSTDEWSVDGWWRRRKGRARETTNLPTGLPRKAFLILVVGFYFAAGVCKLSTAGWSWADGHTIAYFADERGQYTLIGTFLAGQPQLCQAGAVISLCLELGALLALCGARLRLAMLVGWTGMHVAINLIMGPDYWENVWCFMLLVDANQTRSAAGRLGARIGLPGLRRRRDPSAEAAATRSVARGGNPSTASLWAASTLPALVAVVAFTPLFWWPMTNVYMYCSYFSLEDDIRADEALEVYSDPIRLQELARRYQLEQPPIEATEYLAYRTRLFLEHPDGTMEEVERPPGTADRKQFVLTIARPVLIEDLIAKPTGRIAFDPAAPDMPAQRFLEDYERVFRRDAPPGSWSRGDLLQFVLELDENGTRQVPIASLLLD